MQVVLACMHERKSDPMLDGNIDDQPTRSLRLDPWVHRALENDHYVDIAVRACLSPRL